MLSPAMFNGVALVTGAATGKSALRCPSACFPLTGPRTRTRTGIGRQCARSFASEGCRRIALLDRDEDGLSETARLCKAQAAGPGSVQTFVIPLDVRSEAEVQASMDLVIEEWGRIDYAVNCAGIYPRTGAPSHHLSAAEFDAVNNINYRGTWLCERAEIAQMLKQDPRPTHDGRPGNRGAVVNVACVFSLVCKMEARESTRPRLAVRRVSRG